MSSKSLEEENEGLRRELKKYKEGYERFKDGYEKYREGYKHTLDQGNWFPFLRYSLAFIGKHHLSSDQAILLQSIMNMEAMQKNKIKDGWIYCSIKQIQKSLSMNPRSQQRVLKELIKKKFVQVRFKGIPKRRQCKINYDLFNECILQARENNSKKDNTLFEMEKEKLGDKSVVSTGDKSVVSTGDKSVVSTGDKSVVSTGDKSVVSRSPLRGEHSKNGFITPLPHASAATDCAPKRPHTSDQNQQRPKQKKHRQNTKILEDGFLSSNLDGDELFAKDCANKLYKGLERQQKITRRADLKKWSQEFLGLLYFIKDREKIVFTLDWYLNHVDQKFVPQAYCARTFREKFAGIVKAIGRKVEKADGNRKLEDHEVV